MQHNHQEQPRRKTGTFAVAPGQRAKVLQVRPRDRAGVTCFVSLDQFLDPNGPDYNDDWPILHIRRATDNADVRDWMDFPLRGYRCHVCEGEVEFEVENPADSEATLSISTGYYNGPPEDIRQVARFIGTGWDTPPFPVRFIDLAEYTQEIRARGEGFLIMISPILAPDWQHWVGELNDWTVLDPRTRQVYWIPRTVTDQCVIEVR